MMKKIIFIAAILFVLHIVEELITGFHKVDPSILFLGQMLSVETLIAFIFVQILLGILISLAYFTEVKAFKVILGLAFIVELTHVMPSILSLRYTPGLLTALALVGAGIVYWKKLLKLLI